MAPGLALHALNQVSLRVLPGLPCINAGDILRMMALWSDDYLRQQLGGVAFDASMISAMATPQPPPGSGQITLLAVEDVRMLPDGRVTAQVHTQGEIDVILFRNVAGEYRIDGNIELSRDGMPAP